jgi:hypothetical protein
VFHHPDRALTAIDGTAKYALGTAGASIHIGGKNDPVDRFLPEIHATRPGWNDATFLKIRHADAQRSQGEKHRIVKGRGKQPELDAIEWKIGGRTHHFIQGSVEHTITYDSQADVPAGRVETYDVDFPAGNLEWHLQPALMQQEQDQHCQRPDNVVGSYAIYGPASGNFLDALGNPIHEYATGKFCHVYRPQLIAADGTKVWCSQQYDPTAGRLVISLPADFVASAQYPLTLDPTFGYSGQGASYTQWYSPTCGCHPSLCYAASAGDLLTDIKICACSSDGSCGVAAYVVNGGVVGARIGGAHAVQVPTDEPTWSSAACDGLVLGNATYGLAFGNIGSSGLIVLSDDMSPTVMSKTSTVLMGTLDNPFGATQMSSTSRFSIYADYVLNPNSTGGPFPHHFRRALLGGMIG